MFDTQGYNIRNYSPKPVIAQPFNKALSEYTYDDRFAYEFCDFCENCKLCCCASFCLPCLYCTIYSETQEGCCCSFLHSFFNYNHSALRTKIRSTYKIHGSIIEDQFYTSAFPCCAAIQMKQELISRGQSDFEK